MLNYIEFNEELILSSILFKKYGNYIVIILFYLSIFLNLLVSCWFFLKK